METIKEIEESWADAYGIEVEQNEDELLRELEF